MTDLAAYALVLAVAILSVLAWFTNRGIGETRRNIGEMRRDFRDLIAEMRADRAQMTEGLKAMQDAVRACNRLADAVIALVRRQRPEAPAE
jgi:hypothetical protein